MSEIIYQLRNVIKEYGSRSVLQVDQLDVYKGEILTLVGPSGAGKSTLLRLLNFLEPPTRGEIRFLGARATPGQSPSLSMRRRVTMVFQQPVLLARSVWANVGYGLRLRGRRDPALHIAQVLEQVGLKELAQRRANTLSGGEAQRVALARAMVLEPDVLLLDEPTANLDPYNVGLIEDIIRKLNQEQGTCIVMVTHNVFQAKRLAHRVALLLKGQIVETAAVEPFFQSPSDPRTSAFVRGEMVY